MLRLGFVQWKGKPWWDWWAMFLLATSMQVLLYQGSGFIELGLSPDSRHKSTGMESRHRSNR